MNISDNHNQAARLLVLAFLAIFLQPVCAQGVLTQKQPKREVRAVWLTTLEGLDWPSCKAVTASGIERQKQELAAILDSLQKVNINTVLFQTRIRGTVIYPSAMEPWDACLTGKPGRAPGYDPLAFAVEECHRRGMEIQAWVVAVPLGAWNSSGCKALRGKHPDIVMRHNGQGYIDPSRQASARYLARLCSEIVSRYDVDGIHLDYIRYPETLRRPAPAAARANITRIVDAVRDGIKSLKPWVKLSCAVIGKRDDLKRTPSYGWNAFDAGRQDVEEWMRRGLVDQLYPMMYFRKGQFYPFLFDWAENSHGCDVIPGLGVYMLSPNEGRWPADEIVRQMSVSRSAGMGFALFREKFLRNYAKPIYSFIKDFAPYPSLSGSSAMGGAKPEAPGGISVKQVGGHYIVSWDGGTGGGLRYNVYASAAYPVDISEAGNILALKVEGCQVAAKAGGKMYFAVTAIDRYGRESLAAQQAAPAPDGIETVHDLPVIDIAAGGDATLPPLLRRHSTGAVVIKDLAGADVAVRPCAGGSFSTKGVKCGFYAIYSLNKKGVIHRLSFLKITPGQAK